MELSFRKQLRDFFYIDVPNHHDPERCGEWFVFFGKIFMFGTLISFVLSIFVHQCVEKPCLALTKSFFMPKEELKSS